MFRILESQAPAKQNATDTISTLSARLQNALLLEDRRAAILGLRSFAKLYPASVASGALRSLISSLNKDGEDADTTKVVLETLLILFSPDESSPEASDDIALWLADEFTQRQDNITILLDLLEKSDFYSRLYSLQLLSAISTARPERTQECVYTAPLGVSRLVAILDDRREAVRSEGLLLLVALTPSSSEFQKLVAFENAFDRLFDIIHAEGSLTHGGVVIQDCLSLLANLLRHNVSNQSYFRETGCIPRVTRLLSEVFQDEGLSDEISEWAKTQRDKNIWGLLSVIRLFLLRGNVGSQANQASFWQHGVLFQVLHLAFHDSVDIAIKAEALNTCADIIRGNQSLQGQFAQRVVPVAPLVDAPSKVNGHKPKIILHKQNVIQSLLELTLTPAATHVFGARLAACECIKAYLHGHAAIRMYFLQVAREGHLSKRYEAVNILTILVEESDAAHASDPYRRWMAAVILFHLIFEYHDAKKLAMDIVEGDAEQGEEVVTCLQALSSNLVTGAQRGNDERITIGYLMLLCGWLFEDPDAVNDFLGEGSNVQGLIQLAVQSNRHQTLIAGLCAFFLGIIYEFSTKDSPIPRATLHEILTGRLGREQYADRMIKLREHPTLRDYEVLPQGVVPDTGGLPLAYFDKTFVDFFKDNYSRIMRAIDRDPGVEIPVITNGIQKGVSRELVDSLKIQVEDRSKALQTAESEILTLERKLGQEQAEHRKAKESSVIELTRLRAVIEGLQNHQEEQIRREKEKYRNDLAEVQTSSDRLVRSLKADVQAAKTEAQTSAAESRVRHHAELEHSRFEHRTVVNELDKLHRDHLQDLQTAHEEYTGKISTLESRVNRAEESSEEAQGQVQLARDMAEEQDNARQALQTELDDLFIVLADLEEKRMRDKALLKLHGESVSEGEDGVAADGGDLD